MCRMTRTVGALTLLWVGFATAGALALSESGVQSPSDDLVTLVEAKRVCMINNKAFDKDQIPVSIDGRTYYGCCDMCKKKLEEGATSRTAVDPVSGETVDKARAIIGATKDGGVLYFQSEENFRKFNTRKK